MPSTLQLIQNITHLARARLDLSRGLCPGASTPPLFAGLTAMDDSWDERILALEVSRLSRAAKARISRAKQREAAEMASRTSSCRQQGQRKVEDDDDDAETEAPRAALTPSDAEGSRKSSDSRSTEIRARPSEFSADTLRGSPEIFNSFRFIIQIGS